MPLTQAPAFHPLRIADIRRETAACVSLAFDVPAALRASYRFTPGQYLTLRMQLGGVEIRRAYSLCSAPDEAEWRVAIKHVPGGRFSSWANTLARAGMTIDVMTPMGRFGAGIEGRGHTIIAIAAGSGITPVLSIMTSILARDAAARFVLLYGNRGIQDIIFREQIENLKDRYLTRLSVLHVLSREQQDIAALNGRLDGARLRLLLPGLADPAQVARVFLCGPEAMLAALPPVLHDLGITAPRIQMEHFTPAPHDTLPRDSLPAPAETAPRAIVSAILGGARRDFPVYGDDALIDAAQRAGLDLPFSCKGGMCCTCRAKILEGSVAMTANYSLEPWEIAAGFVLTCQAQPTSARVVVDYDQV